MMFSVSMYYPFWITSSVSLTFMILSVSPGYQVLLVTTSVFLRFMMLSVSLDYQLLLISPSVFSNVYDVVSVSWL